MFNRFATILSILLLWASAHAAGIYAEQTVTSSDGVSHSKLWITNTHFRLEDQDKTTIGQFDRGVFRIFYSNTKVYDEIDSKELRAMMKELGADSASTTVSPDAFARTGKTKLISGIETYEVRLKKAPKSQGGLLGVMDELTLWMSKQSYPVSGKFLAWLMETTTTMRWDPTLVKSTFGDGFPMEVQLGVFGQTTSTRTTKIEVRDAPASLFDIPAGYTRSTK